MKERYLEEYSDLQRTEMSQYIDNWNKW